MPGRIEELRAPLCEQLFDLPRELVWQTRLSQEDVAPGMYSRRAILVEPAPGERDPRTNPGSGVIPQALDQLDSGLAAIEEHLGDDDLRRLPRGHARCGGGVLRLQR